MTVMPALRVASALIVTAGVLVFIGCEKKSEPPIASKPPSTAPAPAHTPQTPKPESPKAELPPGHPPVSGAAPATQAKKKYTFGVIAKSQGNPVFQAAKAGAMDAAKDLTKDNVEVVIDWRTPNSEDAQQQAQYIAQLVTAGVDGIAVSVSDAKVLTSAIDSAVDKGVPVVCFDSDAPQSKRFAMYGMDDFSAGQVLGEQMCRALADKGVVAILAGNQNATNLQNRVRGVRDALSKKTGVSIKDVYYHVETAPEAVAKIKQVQGANPDITGWAMVGGWPLFTEKALDGVADKGVKVVAIDIVDTELVYVRSGEVQMLVGQNCHGWGSESVKLLYNLAHKGEKPKEAIIRAPVDIVTKDNVEQFAGMWAKWLGQK